MQREDWILRNLRATRAAPPARAADDLQRRQLFGASLEQFEQLLLAAEGVGPAARPLPLFYALSQAGRAIVAARGEQMEVNGHGLGEDRLSPPPKDPLHRRIKRVAARDDRDAFGAVSQAIGSADFVAPVELGAVWVALPGTYRIPVASWLPEWRASLSVLDETAYKAEEGRTRVQVMSMGGNPHHDGGSSLRGRYPTLPSDTRVGLKPDGEKLGAGNWIAVMTWSAEHDLDSIAPGDRRRDGARALTPTLPDQTVQLHPLMMWWLLLFGLSIFARYHPAVWAQALDVDRSELAVPLEGVLDQAVAVVPALVYDALLT